MEYILSAIIAWLILCIVLQNREHKKTIDKLTDKLMARDYGEYKRHTMPSQDSGEKVKPRKAMSFYDDPSVEVEDDKVN